MIGGLNEFCKLLYMNDRANPTFAKLSNQPYTISGVKFSYETNEPDAGGGRVVISE